MNEEIKPGLHHRVKGHVKMEYTAPGKETILAVEGENKAFLAAFEIAQLHQYLDRCSLLMTHFEGEYDPSFPLLPGNIIGYGTPGEGSSGIYRGAYDRQNSLLDKVSPDGESATYKFVYDFTPTQVPDEIDFLGLSMQAISQRAPMIRQTVLRAQGADYMTIFPFGSIPVNTYLSFSKASGVARSISVYVPSDTPYISRSTSKTADIGALITPLLDEKYGISNISSIWVAVVGIDADTGLYFESYALYLPGGLGNVQCIFVFDEDFTSVLHTEYIENILSPPALKHGVYMRAKNKLLGIAQSDRNLLAVYDLAILKSGGTYLEAESVLPYEYLGGRISLMNLYHYGCRISLVDASRIVLSISGSIAFVFNIDSESIYAMLYDTYPIMASMDYSGERCLVSGMRTYSSTDQAVNASGAIVSPRTNEYYMGYFSYSALTCYQVPADVAPRPEGYGITISYEITVSWT